MLSPRFAVVSAIADRASSLPDGSDYKAFASPVTVAPQTPPSLLPISGSAYGQPGVFRLPRTAHSSHRAAVPSRAVVATRPTLDIADTEGRT